MANQKPVSELDAALSESLDDLVELQGKTVKIRGRTFPAYLSSGEDSFASESGGEAQTGGDVVLINKRYLPGGPIQGEPVTVRGEDLEVGPPVEDRGAYWAFAAVGESDDGL